ncbi:MAG: 50S ribosomal protein L18 [Candidatus Altiarchaeales archaeon]|nr:MAG: 50S ribosomal protein L18 [Candidatus Altiarchaeales archaeon]HDI73181.1 50S ribosomal protein L18 [Candidatus Altiarchaeales archaeon]
MAKGADYVVQYRRKREGKTNYKKRLNLLKSRKSRLVIRKSNKRIIAQIVDYDEKGDRIIASADSNELRKYDWKFSTSNLPAAYLTGFLCAKRGISKGNKEATLDMGLHPPIKGSRIYSALKGAIDSGLQVPKSDGVFPDEKRIAGGHIIDYASMLDKKDYEKRFSGYIKAGVDPKEITRSFEDVKNKIEKSFQTQK